MQNCQKFNVHQKIAIRFKMRRSENVSNKSRNLISERSGMSLFQKSDNFGKSGFRIQPQIVQMGRSSGIRVRILFLTNDSDLAPESDFE